MIEKPLNVFLELGLLVLGEWRGKDFTQQSIKDLNIGVYGSNTTGLTLLSIKRTKLFNMNKYAFAHVFRGKNVPVDKKVEKTACQSYFE